MNKSLFKHKILFAAFVLVMVYMVIRLIDNYTLDKSADTAAWVQALGSIGALAVAIWLSMSQENRRVRAEQRERDEGESVILDALLAEMGVIYMNHIGGVGRVLKALEGNITNRVEVQEFEGYKAIYLSLGKDLALIKNRGLLIKIMEFYNNFDIFLNSVKRHNGILGSSKSSFFTVDGLSGSPVTDSTRDIKMLSLKVEEIYNSCLIEITQYKNSKQKES